MVPFFWSSHTPTVVELAILVSTGITSTIGHFLQNTAYRHAEASVLTPFFYAQIISASGMGWLVFGQFPDRSRCWALPSSAPADRHRLYRAQARPSRCRRPIRWNRSSRPEQTPGSNGQGALAARGDAGVVGHQHQGGAALAVQFEHQLDDRFAGGRIEAAGGFVGKQQRRLGDEGACQRHALLLAPERYLG
jgi:hypothetical protein